MHQDNIDAELRDFIAQTFRECFNRKLACTIQAKERKGYTSQYRSYVYNQAVSITSHSEITGDFNSAYAVKTTSHSEGGPAALPRDTTMTIEAKWLGACKPDQKPGDVVMPGGFKVNAKDAEKLKGLAPK